MPKLSIGSRSARCIFGNEARYHSDKYAWTVGSSGIQSWEPERRIMLSLTLGN